MMEKIKQFFAGITSVTILLYAIGYIIHFAHGKMLGICMVDPVPQEYLITGGTFFLSNCFALYSTIIPYWFLYLGFIIFACTFWFYHQHQQKKNQPRLLYLLIVFAIKIIYLVWLLPLFSLPLSFKDFLMRQYEPISSSGFFSNMAAGLRTWIINENAVNALKLTGFYVSLLLATAFIGLVFYCLWQVWGKQAKPQNTTKRKGWRTWLPRIVPVYLVLAGIITATLIVFIPIQFGVLMRPNVFPEVRLTTVPGVDLMPNRKPDMDSQLWLLRDNNTDLLLHAVYIEKGNNLPVYKVLILKKAQVQTIEILTKSFIFKSK